MTKSKYVTEIEIIDPDTNAPVSISVYKEIENGGIFAIDSSYIDQVFEDGEDIIVNSLFHNNETILID